MEEEIVCLNCGYSWKTKSELLMITCPSCQLKVKNPNKSRKENE